MKLLETPHAWMVYAGVGMMLWLAFAIGDWMSGHVTWRIFAYLLLAVGAIYMFLRALSSMRRKSRPDS